MPIFRNGGLTAIRNTATTTTATGIWSINDQAINQREGLWPVFVETDPYWNSVQLYAKFNGDFTDSRGRTTLSASGVTTSTAQVKYGSGSSYFGAQPNTNYLGLSNANLAPGTGDYTVEYWHYYIGYSGNGSTFLFRNQVVPNYYGALTFQSGSLWGPAFYCASNGLYSSNGGTAFLSLNEWHHIAYVRQSGTLYVYADGVQYTLGSDSINVSLVLTRLGNNVYNDENVGYIDDLRVTIGVARYTSGFTPPSGEFPTQ